MCMCVHLCRLMNHYVQSMYVLAIIKSTYGTHSLACTIIELSIFATSKHVALCVTFKEHGNSKALGKDMQATLPTFMSICIDS